jgi:hypothetical protein
MALPRPNKKLLQNCVQNCVQNRSKQRALRKVPLGVKRGQDGLVAKLAPFEVALGGGALVAGAEFDKDLAEAGHGAARRVRAWNQHLPT